MNQDRMKSQGDRNRPTDMEKAKGSRESIRGSGSGSSSERGSSNSSSERSSGERSREECDQDELSDQSGSER